jgi:hypothetical protein
LNPRLHEAQLENRKLRKAQENHLEEGKAAKLTNGTKSVKTKKNQRRAQNQTPHNHLHTRSPP